MTTDNAANRDALLKTLRAKLEAIRQKQSQPKATQVVASDQGQTSTPQPSPPESTTQPRAIIYRRDVPLYSPVPHRRDTPGTPVRLEDAVSGFDITHPRYGKAFGVAQAVLEATGSEKLCSRLRDAFSTPNASPLQIVSCDCGLDGLTAADVAFVDLETAGLSSSPLFLLGALVWERDGFHVHQFLARDYAEEAAVIALGMALVASHKAMVTFNGKTFDLPFIRGRAAVHGIRPLVVPMHFDLLHACRRVWKDKLPDCRLQTLETLICNRPRYGDIPGERIPEAYHAFVRTRNARELVEILKHNMLDLVTLADLLTRLPRDI